MRLSDWLLPGLALACAAGLGAHGCGRAKRQPPEASRDAGARALASAPPSERPRGNVRFVVHDPSGTKLPCKLTLLGREGTPDPDLGEGQPTRAVEGGIAAHARVFSLSGSGGFSVPEGSYEVWVSRGLEWSLETRRISVGKSAVELDVTLENVVPTAGWLSADMHVHAAPSWDSKVPLSARVLEFVSEGVDVLVATDHNVVTDYQPEIERAGAKQLLGTVAGSEISTTDWGHFGAFPMRDEKTWWVLHGVRMNGMNPDELLGALRRHAPTALVTVNHPRLGKLGYMNLGGFDPKSARFVKPRVSFDFDAIEVMNGAKHGSVEAVDRVMADWFALLGAGRRVTAVGNSDTHELVTSFAGYPRNYVELPEAGPAVDPDRLSGAFREGSSFFTSGPFVEARIGKASFGELARADKGRVTLALSVRAAPWISATRLRVYVGQAVAKDLVLPAPSPRPVSRFADSVVLDVESDAFVVVRVDGSEPLPPVVSGPGAAPLYPVAVTNPIWVDADGDGKYRVK